MTRRQFVSRSIGTGVILSSRREHGGATPTSKSILETVRDAEPLDNVEVIDTHAHFSGALQNGKLPSGVRKLIQAMDRCGIDQTVFSNSSAIGAATPEVLRAGNEAAVAAVKAHPDRLRAYLAFQPHFLDASLAMAEQILDPDSGLVGFKLHGVSHNYPVDGESYRRAYQFAHEHRLTVLFHVKSSHGAETPTLRGESLPIVVSRVLDEFTEMKLIIAHFGRSIDDWADFTAKHPNAFMETAASGVPYRILERTVAAAGPDRILFGTDSTYLSPGAQLAKIAFADIPEQSKKQIFAWNARRVFGSNLAAVQG
jgi:predicted TIM-barrel fold metal-dependent hydrolase